MDSQKLENMLNLSLNISETDRAKSQALNVGFDAEEQTWELIVKFHGNIERLRQEGIQVEVLLAGYAVVTLSQSRIPLLTASEEIEYIEMPKELIYNVYFAKQQACFPATAGVEIRGNGIPGLEETTERNTIGERSLSGLSGRGCLVAVFDSGIDYTLVDFLESERSAESRIRYLWDQSLTPDPDRGFYPPEGFTIGVEFSREQINEALRVGGTAGFQMVPSRDVTGHGTAVAAIAAGSNPNRRYTGAAPGAELLVVKLGPSGNSPWPRTTQLMRAFSYALQKAQALGMPLAVNLSFGNSYGPHDGTTLLERFIDNASEVWKNVICVGSGNEGAAAGHVAGRLQMGQSERIELSIGTFETTLSIQLWKNFADTFRVILQAPSGIRLTVPMEQDMTGRSRTIELQADGTRILLFIGEPSPYSVNQEIFFDLIPAGEYIASGIWTFLLEPVEILTGEFQMYLPGETVRSEDTRFYAPTPELTLTIPSTAGKVITVGAVNGNLEAYADFSGRGIRGQEELPGFPNTKPDLAAPGVNIMAARAGGGYASYTGTSFATPLVTGAAALLMEWGIVRGNDPYLYGEKVKAWLQRGAKAVRGGGERPNSKVGYGALCVSASMPQQPPTDIRG